MVDQVTFPPSIGGSGKTYTNDANPQTGMFNGGHRVNFFPILADTVAAAGYVSRYAQAIDGAKANADKAEDAKGYVEAVADQLHINILDQFRRKAIIDIDFAQGVYRSDDGVVTESTNAGDVLTVTRSTAQRSVGYDGYPIDFGINAVSRKWSEDGHVTAIIYPSYKNMIKHSENYAAADWNAAGGSFANRDEPSSWADTCFKFSESDTSGVHRFSQVIPSFTNGITYVFSQEIKLEERSKARVELFGGAFTTSICVVDLITLEISQSSYDYAVAEKLQDGWIAVHVFKKATANDTASLRTYIDNGAGAAYQGDGVSGFLVGATWVAESSVPVPYTKTEGTSSVTTSKTDIVKSVSMRPDKFTILLSCEFYSDPLDFSHKSAFSLSSSETAAGSDYLSVAFFGSEIRVRTGAESTLINKSVLPLPGVPFRAKIGISYDQGQVHLFLNGELIGSGITETNPKALNFIRVANLGTSSSIGRLAAGYEYLILNPYFVTSAELKALTAQ